LTAEQERELRGAGRYEWEQILRRARLAAVIPASGRRGKKGKVTKGGMSGNTFTGIALGWASYASDRGREIWPGDATVAVDLETSIDAVRKVRKALLALGLLEFVRNRTATRGVEYRLTLPSDLLESLEVLTPAQHKIAALRLRDAARGKSPGESGGPPSDEALGDPPDHPSDPDEADTCGSSGPPEIESGGSGGSTLGGPVDSLTAQDRSIGTTTDHSDADLDTAVTVPSGPTPDQDPDFSDGKQPRLRLVHGRRGLGFCWLCYDTGQTTLAADPINGDACALHLREKAS
jgi:hypothetical protein